MLDLFKKKNVPNTIGELANVFPHTSIIQDQSFENLIKTHSFKDLVVVVKNIIFISLKLDEESFCDVIKVSAVSQNEVLITFPFLDLEDEKLSKPIKACNNLSMADYFFNLGQIHGIDIEVYKEVVFDSYVKEVRVSVKLK